MFVCFLCGSLSDCLHAWNAVHDEMLIFLQLGKHADDLPEKHVLQGLALQSGTEKWGIGRAGNLFFQQDICHAQFIFQPVVRVCMPGHFRKRHGGEEVIQSLGKRFNPTGTGFLPEHLRTLFLYHAADQPGFRKTVVIPADGAQECKVHRLAVIELRLDERLQTLKLTLQQRMIQIGMDQRLKQFTLAGKLELTLTVYRGLRKTSKFLRSHIPGHMAEAF